MSMRWTPEVYAAWRAREAARLASEPASQLPATPEPVRICLPWPPSSANTAVRHGNGAHYLTEAHKAYRKDVRDLVAGMRLQPVAGRLKVTLHIAPPTRRRADIANYEKQVVDALQPVPIPDDALIDVLHLERTPVVKGGAIYVTVESL